MMKSRIARIAAAIVVVVGLGGVLTRLVPGDVKSGIAFADVVRYFTQAHTAKYTVTIELEGHKPVSIKRLQIFQDKSFFENKGWLWDKSGPMGIQIMPRDWTSSGQACDPVSEGFEGETLYFFGRADSEGIQDFFQLMSQVYERAEADLGNQEIDGQPAVGFRFHQDGTVYSIWASAVTALPLRIEITNQRLLGKGKITLREFKFDVEIPSPPLTRFGFGADQWKWSASEDELLKAMGQWAKRHKGQFPRYLTHQAWFFKTPRHFLQNPDLDLETRQKIFKLTSRVIIKGLMFASQLPAGDNWSYMGNGMSLDPQDSDTPICWYQPENSDTYHVIYRDLSVRNLTPDELPIPNVAE